MAVGLVLTAAAASIAVVISILSGPTHFIDNACGYFESYLSSVIVGQDLALKQISDAVCDHLGTTNRKKPLVISIHGPPGVGKSLFHQLAAQALYNTRPRIDLRCPGNDCPAYRVLFGLDYTEDDRDAQHTALRNSLYNHVTAYQESLLVIEEYDKLDCHMRGFFRHLLQGNLVGNISLAKSIVILESNTGFMDIKAMLDEAPHREKISPVHAQQSLKDLIFKRWHSQQCEHRTDTQKMINLADFYLPFFPLEKQHIEEIFQRSIQTRIDEFKRKGEIDKDQGIHWNDDIIQFLTQKVQFEGRYSIEGGKEVSRVVSSYVSRPLREFVDVKRKEARNQREIKNKKKRDKEKKKNDVIMKFEIDQERDRLQLVK